MPHQLIPHLDNWGFLCPIILLVSAGTMSPCRKLPQLLPKLQVVLFQPLFLRMLLISFWNDALIPDVPFCSMAKGLSPCCRAVWHRENKV